MAFCWINYVKLYRKVYEFWQHILQTRDQRIVLVRKPLVAVE